MDAFTEWTFEGGLNEARVNRMNAGSRSRREPNPLSMRHV